MKENIDDKISVSNVYNVYGYWELLTPYKIAYEKDVLYIRIGHIPNIQGWVFFIPVSLENFVALLNIIIPYVANKKIGMKIPINKVTHQSLIEGALGAELWGKVVCVYIEEQDNIVEIANDLIKLTEFIKGGTMPAILLGGLIYTRFSMFEEIITPDGSYIMNSFGEYEKEKYTIPYIIPEWLKWPFGSIVEKIPSEPKMILNKKYFIVRVLRDTPKGRIILAIKKKNIFQIRKVLIKEGRPGTFGDDFGRDIVDRLKWQKKLHEKFSDKVAIPRYVDYFVEANNSYLCIEYIEGTRFEDFLDLIFRHRSWVDLSTNERKLLITCLIQIFDHVIRLHTLGLIHRDISVANFIVDKKGKIIMIDLELAYDITTSEPTPPFQIGSPGYVAPEVYSNERSPSSNQDIFSLGALMIVVLSHLAPRKFYVPDTVRIWNNILFFLKDERLTNIIISCLNPDPPKRPQLPEIRKMLANINDNVTVFSLEEEKISICEIDEVINSSILNLTSNLMLNDHGLWMSLVSDETDFRNVLVGFERGISGILFLLAKLKGSGYDIDKILPVIETNWKFIESRFLFAGKDVPSGLFNGSNGIAVSIVSAIEGGILPCSEQNIKHIKNCLYNIPDELDIANGLSGYGLSLLYCGNYLEQSFLEERLSFAITEVLKLQDAKGGWVTSQGSNKNKVYYSNYFYNGIPGITYFLLECCRIRQDRRLVNAVKMALNYMAKVDYKREETISSILRNKVSIGYAYLKAFEIFKDVEFKYKCMDIILNIPERFIDNDYSFNRGILGLGMFYLECYKILEDKAIIYRIKWIVQVFLHSAIRIEGKTYWVQGHISFPSADLMAGNSGIIYFLMKSIEVLKSDNMQL